MLSAAFLLALFAPVASQDASGDAVYETASQVMADIDSCIESRGARSPSFERLLADGWKSTETGQNALLFRRGLARITLSKVMAPAGVSCIVQVPAAFESFTSLLEILHRRFGAEGQMRADRSFVWKQPDYDVRVIFNGKDPSNWFALAEVTYPIAEAK